ncbi:hypothetical protein Ahy_A10g050483 [Arachis hypogaea]|uniref:Aminotransferase-like plant mobile domain-containing protein n=1 Tax=Arachis hypogaea TaxID=3818 RepID=A0A445B9G9_ARAHY|nr:hypothetical protein Ahy_A10g050483 [Arachis hypogaea]
MPSPSISTGKGKSTPANHQTATSGVRSDRRREAAWSIACAHRKCLEDAFGCPAWDKTQLPSTVFPQVAVEFLGLCGFARNPVAFWNRYCHQEPLVHWRTSPSRSVASLGHHGDTVRMKLLETRCSPCYIADLFKELKTNQDQAKLDEIEEIGFGFLKLVPKWQVRQGIMVMLAKAYDTETSTLKIENGNIRIVPEIFQGLFGIPPKVDDFPPFDSSNAAHVSIKTRYHRLKTVQLRHFVRHCPMDTEDDRMEFRRHFILLVLKIFLCPTVQHVISPWHIDTVLDVSDPARYHWPLHIFNSLEQAIRKYQHKKNKSCEGCMLGLLLLYFQKLKHGELEGCQEPEPWLSAWTAKELSAMAETIQPEVINLLLMFNSQQQDCSEPGRDEDKGKEDASIEHRSDPSSEREDVEHRKESSRGHGVREAFKHPDTHAVASDGDDDDDKPIAKRLHRRSVSRMTPQSCMRAQDARTTNKTKEKEDPKGSSMKGGVSGASLGTTYQTRTSEEEDDDDQPIGIRICIKTLQRKTPHRGMVEGKIITSIQWESTNQPTETVAPEPKTPSTDLVEFPEEMVLVPKNLEKFHDGPNPTYVGLGQNFGVDTIYFDKEIASNRNWDVIKLYKLEIILDIIILCHKNISIGAALNALDSSARPPVRRNQPRNKRMEVRIPFTAPDTKSILRRAGGKPKKKSTRRS